MDLVEKKKHKISFHCHYPRQETHFLPCPGRRAPLIEWKELCPNPVYAPALYTLFTVLNWHSLDHARFPCEVGFAILKPGGATGLHTPPRVCRWKYKRTRLNLRMKWMGRNERVLLEGVVRGDKSYPQGGKGFTYWTVRSKARRFDYIPGIIHHSYLFFAGTIHVRISDREIILHNSRQKSSFDETLTPVPSPTIQYLFFKHLMNWKLNGNLFS